MKAITICSRCVMDTTDSKICFDNDGVCDHCLTFDAKIQPSWNSGKNHEDQLAKTVDKIRMAGKGKDFDCILGMSGGIDSSYLLYLVAEKLQLRPLVFHVDAGWNSQIAVNNIERLVDGLGLDLYTEVIDWEEIKDLQRSFFYSGVAHIDTPQDHAFFATMYKFASKYKVRHIVTGGNYSTECVRNPKEWMYYQSDSRQLRDIHKRFGRTKLIKYPVTNILWHKVYLPYVRRIKTYRLLDQMVYKKEEATQLLVDRFGFQKYPQKHFESRFTKFYESYWLPQKFGFDTRKVQYSSMILTGQMSRAEALENLRKSAFKEDEIEREFEYVADKIDMSVDELRACFSAPNRSYEDYKNQDVIYDVGSWVSRLIGLERGGKR